MATLDIPQLAALLQSTKVKDKNDALTQLEFITTSRWRLPLKQLRILANAIFRLLEYDSQQFISSKSNTQASVASRLNRASYFLRLLVEKSIADKLNLKYKFYLEICFTIKSLFYVQNQPLSPCAIDFSLTLSGILGINYVNDHLSGKDWFELYAFLVSAAEQSLDDITQPMQYGGINEKVLIEIWEALQNILQCNRATTTLQLFENEAYFRILTLLNKTISAFKKENPIHITIFKILNKLIVVLATTDFKFVNKLIELGIKLMVVCNKTHWEKLQDQFLIFLNLQTTHNFMNLLKLPKLVGDSEIELSFLSEDPIESQRNVENSSELLHNIELLIVELLNDIIMLPSIISGSIGPFHCNNNLDWFNLRSIRLHGIDARSWLFITATTKLLETYFALKNTPLFLEEVNRPVRALYTDANFNNLVSSYNMIDFCNSMVLYRSTPEYHNLSLLLMVFYLELEPLPKNEQDNLLQTNDFLGASEKTNTSFDFTISGVNETPDLLEFLQNMLNTVDYQSGHFWLILLARSTLYKVNFQELHVTKKYDHLRQILKLALYGVNKQHNYFACDLVSQLVLRLHCNPNKIVDDAVITQLDSIIDFPGVNGPSINNESFEFWYAINKLSIDLNLAKKDILARKIDEWLCEKWDFFFAAELHVCVSINEFVYWLSGFVPKTCHKSKRQIAPEDVFNTPMRLQISRQQLESFFVLLHLIEEDNGSTHGPTPITPQTNFNFWNKIAATFGKLNTAPISYEKLFSWMITLLKISLRLSGFLGKHELWDTLNYQITVGLEAFSTFNITVDTALNIMRMTVDYSSENVATDFDFLSKVPFEKLLRSVVSSLQSRNKRAKRPLDDEDIEFSEVRESSVTPASSSLEANSSVGFDSSPIFDLMRFKVLQLRVSGKDDMEVLSHLLSFIEQFGSEAFLLALLFIIGNQVPKIELVGHKQPLIRLLRLLGDRVLSDQVFERNETVLVIVSRILSCLIPLLSTSTDDALYRDCFDIVQWLYALGSKNYITTETAFQEYVKFLIVFMQHNDERLLSHTMIMEELYLKFSKSTNHIKSRLVGDFSKFVQNRDTSKQMEIYSHLFEYFVTPQSSVERAASYVFFFSHLAASSPTILRLALFNLTECSKFAFFVPYLKQGFEELCLRYNLSSLRELFGTVKLDLLRRWWFFESINLFPFTLFNYDTLSVFLGENYREITAVVVSTDTKAETDFRTSDRSAELLSAIASVKNIAPAALVSESLSLIIPLSYTRDGIKNRCFEILMDYMGKFKLVAKTQLPVIILEILKRLDVSDEAEITKLLPRPEAVSQLIYQKSRVLSNTTDIIVPVHPGLELINKMVEKYHTEKSFFWSTATVYFLIRRVGMSLFRERDLDQLLFELRRIKLILILGGKNAFSVDIFDLIVKTLAPLIDNEVLSHEVFAIVSAFNDTFHICSEQPRSRNPMLPLLNALLSNRHKDGESYDKLVDKLSIYAKGLQGLDKITHEKKVMAAAIKRLSGEQASLQIADIEGVLNEKASFDVIALVSKTFPCVADPEVFSAKTRMLKNILALSNDQLSQLADEFKLWVSKCFSKYYFKTKSSNLLDLLHTEGYKGPYERDLKLDLSFFDVVMRELVEYSKKGNYDEAASAESVLGVFFNLKEENQALLSHIVDVQPIYNSMSGYIRPLKFQACVLLNDEPDDSIAHSSLSNIIDTLDSFLDSNQDSWSSKIYLAILKEVAAFTIIGSIMSVFVIKVPVFASETISPLVCFYLSLAKSKGEETVIALLNRFANLKYHGNDATRVFVGILLGIRLASKIFNNPFFANVYQKVDILKYYELASMSKMHKSALMLFEDAFFDQVTPVSLESQYLTLQKVYEGLDDVDLIYGLPENTSLDHYLTLKFQVGASNIQFQYSSGYLDSSLKLNAPLLDNFTTMMTSAGMLGISLIISKTMNQSVTENETYEWNWKLSKWDQPIPTEEQNEHQLIYKVLKQVHDFPQNGEHVCRQSLLRLMDMHTRGDSMSVKDVRTNFMGWLKSLAAVTAIEDTVCGTSFSTSDEEFPDFAKYENILLAKQTSFQILAEHPPSHTPSDLLWSLSLRELVLYNNLARVNNEQQKMISSTVLIDNICNKLQNSQHALYQNLSHLSLFQLAQCMWKQGVTNVPVLILKELYNAGGVDIYDQESKVDKFMIKAIMIEWMSESRLELSSTLMENHVLPTAERALRLDDQVQQSKIFRLLAQFCDTQCKSKSLSEQIEILEKRVQEKETEIGELKSHYSSSQLSSEEKRSINKFYSKLKVQYKAECMDLDYARASRKQFAVKAIEYYLHAMCVNDFLEEDMDKFCALWLEQSTDDDLNDVIGPKLLSLPTHKLLSWCAQLISRLTKEITSFQTLLKQLILLMCVDHPYHTLHLLYSLKKHKQLAQKDANPLLVSKAIAAEALWRELMNQSFDFVHGTLRKIETFNDECIRLAEFKVSRGKIFSLEKLPPDYSSFWLHNLPQIPPPTKSLKVDKSKSYQDIPVITKIEKKISVASTGLSLPKIVKFILSDGSTHVMLMKHGTDDLRQDSIMEQVFDKVQNIFARDRECSKRRLAIRTYNAVPLGPRSGVIEFVPNSTSFMDAILSYHAKNDKMKLEKARDIMRQCQNQDKIERLHEYQKIEAKIKPVLHIFFQDCFPTPDQWFESRVKYTHGVATSSIVGHILGLGDRHCNNILLDKQNGEPIHIDLGVAFDQGKHLAIPETVPFRLTRDIVDGFGVTGVDGVFRKSCQHTMRVLRENRDHIISILDVLRWDPLYSWTLSPIRKKRLQEEEARLGIQPEQDGSDAGRAVLAVSDKLVASSLSTEAVVRELIQEATSPQNLSLLYFGWCPFY